MAKYDVYPNPDGRGYLLDIQADLLEALNTCVVVPLMPMGDAPIPAKRLNPVFEVGGEEVVMVTQFLSAVPRSVLRGPEGSLKAQFAEITDAVDMLVQGF